MDAVAKNLEENKGFVKVRSSLDNVEYKVLDIGTSSEKSEVALILSKVRRDLNKLMIYLCKNPQLWINLPIAYGIIHTFDIHLPCLSYLLDDILTSDNPCELIIKNGNLFNIQEMTPNQYGIIGLNKPKELKKIKRLSSNEQKDIIGFLYTLTDKEFLYNPRYQFPR